MPFTFPTKPAAKLLQLYSLPYAPPARPRSAGFQQGVTPIEEMLEARALYSQAIALSLEADQALAMSLVALSYGSGRL